MVAKELKRRGREIKSFKSGWKNAGNFPCVDMFEKIDMRTQNYDVPPNKRKKINEWSKVKVKVFLLNFKVGFGSADDRVFQFLQVQ